MYHVFLKRWQREFRKLLLLRSEQHFSNTKAVLARELAFLGLDAPVDDASWGAMLSPPVQLAGPRPEGGAPPMSADAIKMLREFYAPGLRELVDTMQGEPDAAEWRAWAESS